MINCNDEIIQKYLDLGLSQNRKILHRNGKDWEDDFCLEFDWGELSLMKEFVYAHPVNIEYDLNEYESVSELVHDYIAWLVYDLIFDGQYREAKAVLNNGYVS